MKALKNIGVGFLVSFLGSIPLGYLNVVGYEVFSRSGIKAALLYLLGVICIEAIVIYFTLIFANRLMDNKKLIRYIEGFSIVFMFVLAYIFYASSSGKTTSVDALQKYSSPFVLGIVLSCLNFIQIPFWTGWNLYLLNAKYIEINKSLKFLYVFGTLLGTFSGMITLILGLDYITNKSGFLSKYLMGVIIPLVFAGLGIFQAIKFYSKYYIGKSKK